MNFFSSVYFGTRVCLVIFDKGLRKVVCFWWILFFSHFQIYLQILILQIAHDYYHLFLGMAKDTGIYIP